MEDRLSFRGHPSAGSCISAQRLHQEHMARNKTRDSLFRREKNLPQMRGPQSLRKSPESIVPTGPRGHDP